MKRFTLALFALTALGTAATAQTDLSGFQDAMQSFATDMSLVLDASSTTGNTWSSAYVGSFPKFGVGVAVSACFVPADSAESLFDTLGISLPSEIKKYGIPIPAAVATLKIGIPFLPIDVGVKGGVIPETSISDIQVAYQTMGVNVRYALLKDTLVTPALSVGASWNYVKGSVGASIGSGTYDYTYDTYAIHVSSPDMALDWEANTFDFTLQVSKNLLIFTPYAGAGLTLGKTTVSAGMSADTTVDDSNTSGSNADEIAALEAAGIDVSDSGFSVSAASTTPVIRVYGGTSINIFLFKLDLMGCYIPATQSWGAQVMARVQL
jgi:hypothetical protein